MAPGSRAARFRRRRPRLAVVVGLDLRLALPLPRFAELWPADSLRCPAWRFRIRFGKAFRAILRACKACWRTRSSLVAARSRSVRVSGRAWPPAASGLPEGVGGVRGGGADFAAVADGRRRTAPAASCGTGSSAEERTGGSRCGRGSGAGAGDERRMEHDAGGGARRRSVGRLSIAAPGRVGAWLAGGRRVRSLCAQARVPRPSAGTTREGAPICTGRPACAAFRPGVECRTSHVLGGVVRRVGGDFEERYRPSGDKDQHAGTSFRAAAWRDRRPGATGPRGNAEGCHERGLAGARASRATCAVGGWRRSGELGGAGVRRCAGMRAW